MSDERPAMHLLRAALTLCSVLLLQANTLYPQWVQSTGFSEGMVFSLAADGVRIFAGCSNGVFVSTNRGISWTAVNNGLTVTSVTCLLVSPPFGGGSAPSVFAGTSGGVFLSTDAGGHWTAVNAGLTTMYVNSLAMSPVKGEPGVMNLFAGTAGGGVFRSTNNGEEWKPTGLSTTQVLALAASDTNLFAGGFIGVYRSADDGATWTHVDGGLGHTPVNELAISRFTTGPAGSNLFAGSAGGGVFLSTDEGTTWTPVDSGLTNMNVQALALSADSANSGAGTVFAGTYGGGVFLSTNNGTSWRAVNEGLTATSISALAVHSGSDGSFLFAGTFDGAIWRRPLTDMIASVHPDPGGIPISNSVSQNYPNPFNPTTKIQFTIVNQQLAIVKVYDVMGREVATLVNEVKRPGVYTVRWNAGGVASGLYICRLQVGDPSTGSGQFFVAESKMLLIR